jgi:hypothetical protein
MNAMRNGRKGVRSTYIDISSTGCLSSQKPGVKIRLLDGILESKLKVKHQVETFEHCRTATRSGVYIHLETNAELSSYTKRVADGSESPVHMSSIQGFTSLELKEFPFVT